MMDWLRTHYDRAAAIAGALFLLGCAFFVWQRTASFEETFAPLRTLPPQRKAAPLVNAARLVEASQNLREPAQWTFSARSGLFVPEKYFIGANGQPATLQNTEVHPPVPNEWFDQFGLPITDADILTQDTDADGFTNIEEWQGRSNPVEKNSHPDYLTKLKLRASQKQKFRMKFDSKSDDTFVINTIDYREPTQFLKLGDTIKGTPFQLVSYQEKSEPNPRTGGETDVSELVLQNPVTQETLILVKEREAMSPDTVAAFVYTWTPPGGRPREISVRRGEEFSLPPEEQIRYKLVDVQTDKATLINTLKPNEPIEIRSVTP